MTSRTRSLGSALLLLALLLPVLGCGSDEPKAELQTVLVYYAMPG